MENPFTEKYLTNKKDAKLVELAAKGDRSALEELITRHQAWIYNIARRMVVLPDDAEDVTQEILIKLVTHLSTFKNQCAFRTWLYRMVANHVVDMRRSRAEKMLKSFSEFGKAIDRTPDMPLPKSSEMPTDAKVIVDETRLSCLTAMLLCLDRPHRLAFVLGAMFRVTDVVGAEIMEISRANFRQRLSRARKKVANFMNEKCGLINKDNPCHCARKAGALLKSGEIKPDNLMFSSSGRRKIKSLVRKKETEIKSWVDKLVEDLHRNVPFYKSPDFVRSLSDVLDNRDIEEAFRLGN